MNAYCIGYACAICDREYGTLQEGDDCCPEFKDEEVVE